MAREKGDYTEYLQRLGLTDDEGANLVGALQRAIDSLLDIHFMLEHDDADQ